LIYSTLTLIFAFILLCSYEIMNESVYKTRATTTDDAASVATTAI